MEKFKEETKSVFNKVEICPRCKNHLERHIENDRIQCPTCGLRIKVSSKYNNDFSTVALTILGIVIFGIGIAYGLLF